jgi:hypothetical protein
MCGRVEFRELEIVRGQVMWYNALVGHTVIKNCHTWERGVVHS